LDAPVHPRDAEGGVDARARSRGAGPWLWSAPIDLAVFGGSALLALALVALAPRLADEGRALPTWGFLLFIVAVDVAHVWSTLFRSYLDPEELARRPGLYAGVPLGCFFVGVSLHAVSSAWFWRVLAYLAVLHFVRQQVGWVAIYRARAGLRSRTDRLIDDAAVYASTLVPLAHWHAQLPRAFHWFVEGDFQPLPWLVALLPALDVLLIASLLFYAARALLHARHGLLLVGKHLVVATTAATWWIGIVATNSDFEFSVANVLVHGIPYLALLYAYTRERAREAPSSPVATLARGGLVGFLALLQLLAFAEEFLWERLVWAARPELFGGDGAPLSPASWTSLVVPLLAVPQATHYVLDAFLWRRGGTGLAQARAMGFAAAPAPPVSTPTEPSSAGGAPGSVERAASASAAPDAAR
jgi:hypothetical protein